MVDTIIWVAFVAACIGIAEFLYRDWKRLYTNKED